MRFNHKYYNEYSYHYNKEFPFELFIINIIKKQQKNKLNYIKINSKGKEIENINGSKCFDEKNINIKKFILLESNYYDSYKDNICNYIINEEEDHFCKNIFEIKKKELKIYLFISELIYTYYFLYNDIL